jgi:hypothetical protein
MYAPGRPFPELLTRQQVAAFQEDGLLILPSFYDLEKNIVPIQYGIYRIIGLAIQKYQLPFTQPPFQPETFDSCFQAIIAYERKIGGLIYDAVKQIPAFHRLLCDERHDALMGQLRGTDFPGIAAGGYGIRIDNPFEEKFRSEWHQEYPDQLRSLDGLVLWSPLVPVAESLGPVQFCPGSHKDGLVPVHLHNPQNTERTGAYAKVLLNRDERLAGYRRVAPLTNPGDLIIVDFLTLHSSGHNTAQRSRWSMQLRYFNFRDPTGIRIGWCGSVASGVDFTKIHPELVAD